MPRPQAHDTARQESGPTFKNAIRWFPSVSTLYLLLDLLLDLLPVR